MGPVAEDAVLGLAKSQNWVVRMNAAIVLGRIGTAKSVPVLEELKREQAEPLQKMATRSCDWVRARMQDK
jgi:HEAT repeat protein